MTFWDLEAKKRNKRESAQRTSAQAIFTIRLCTVAIKSVYRKSNCSFSTQAELAYSSTDCRGPQTYHETAQA